MSRSAALGWRPGPRREQSTVQSDRFVLAPRAARRFRVSLGPMFLNMKLLSHHSLNGFGGMGEGMSMQLARDGRRILWLAHESAPKNFTAVDVSDPRAPKVVVQTDLPHPPMRSNSLEVPGDLLAAAHPVAP